MNFIIEVVVTDMFHCITGYNAMHFTLCKLNWVLFVLHTRQMCHRCEYATMFQNEWEHNNDVAWSSRRLKSLTTWMLVLQVIRTYTKENNKARIIGRVRETRW